MAPALGSDQLVPAPPQRPMEEAAPDHVGDHQGQRRARRHRQSQGGRPVAVGQAARLDHHHRAGERGHAQREGGGEEHLDHGDVANAQAAIGIEMVAQRGADDEGEAGRMRDRLRGERGQRQMGNGMRLPTRPRADHSYPIRARKLQKVNRTARPSW